MDELDEVSNETHDRETDSDSLGDLYKLCTQVLDSGLGFVAILADLCGRASYTG